jgi:hypothetical protein
MEPVDGSSGARVVLWLSNGEPALIDRRAGRGQVVLLTTSVSLAGDPTYASLKSASGDSAAGAPDAQSMPWSMLAAWPSFPPLTHQLVAFAASGADGQRNLATGDRMSGYAPNGVSSVQIAHGQHQEHVLVDSRGGAAQWGYAHTKQPGFYRVSAAPGAADQWFAANVDWSEGDPRRVTPDQLPTGMTVIDAAAESAAADVQRTDPNAVMPPSSFYLWAVAALLLLELCWLERGRPGR